LGIGPALKVEAPKVWPSGVLLVGDALSINVGEQSPAWVNHLCYGVAWEGMRAACTSGLIGFEEEGVRVLREILQWLREQG
jgi:hypothetical protein